MSYLFLSLEKKTLIKVVHVFFYGRKNFLPAIFLRNPHFNIYLAYCKAVNYFKCL